MTLCMLHLFRNLPKLATELPERSCKPPCEVGYNPAAGPVLWIVFTTKKKIWEIALLNQWL